MKIAFVVCALFCSAAFLNAQNIVLPTPVKKGGLPLMNALAERKTIRNFDPQKQLTKQRMADLLWAANGINRPDGRRTAPSAINAQEIDIYVFLADGAYKYEPAKNSLVMVSGKDCRALVGKKFSAPVKLVLVGNGDKQADRMKSAADRFKYACIDSGYVSQNIYLFCASEKMATVAIGRIEPEQIRKALKLDANNSPVLGHAVGWEKK